MDIASFYVILPKYQDWAKNYINVGKNETFLDIGAHIGKYALKQAKKCKKVIAIEADPRNFEALKKGIELNRISNVIPLNIAAWKENKEITLHISELSDRHSVKKDIYLARNSIPIQAKKIDDVLRELNIEKIDFIKIDVEGAEFEVLQGLIQTLKKDHPKIVLEYFHENYKKVIDLVMQFNYHIIKLDSNNCLLY